MGEFLQISALVLAAVILWIVLSQRGKEFGLLLSLGTCAIVLVMLLRFLEPVIALLRSLQALSGMEQEWLEILLKALGVGLVTEMGILLCNDAGNAALGRTLQLLGSGVVLWLSVPLVNSVLQLLRQILGGL